MKISAFIFSILFLPVLWAVPSQATLQPREVALIANGKVAESVALSRLYMEKRKIPPENLLLLSLPDAEHLSREEYDSEVVPRVRAFIRQKQAAGGTIKCLLTVYGIPLVVMQAPLDQQEKAELEKYRSLLRALQTHRKISRGKIAKKALENASADILQQISTFDKSNQIASFDSEIALVMEQGYPLAGVIPNPAFVGFQGKENIQNMPGKAFMVSRIDGPTPQTVERIINDSLSAEKNGLKGTAYFDARWPMPQGGKLSEYGIYDASIHRAAQIVRESGAMSVVLEETERLFGPGECPNAALYCGWYSRGRYIPAFTWATGAVGYHIASTECATLKKKGSKVWCKAMLENGAAATLGPVGEPYVNAFPLPEVFFQSLLQGDLTLAECYARANPFLSWKMVLIGDPLYRPFKKFRGLRD